MTSQEFVDKLKKSDEFEMKDELKDSYIILNKKTEKKYKVSKEFFSEMDWDNIYSVLQGREPIIMDGITRIVGYFSRISNWNKSKLGELADRREGNYRIQ